MKILMNNFKLHNYQFIYFNHLINVEKWFISYE